MNRTTMLAIARSARADGQGLIVSTVSGSRYHLLPLTDAGWACVRHGALGTVASDEPYGYVSDRVYLDEETRLVTSRFTSTRVVEVALVEA